MFLQVKPEIVSFLFVVVAAAVTYGRMTVCLSLAEWYLCAVSPRDYALNRQSFHHFGRLVAFKSDNLQKYLSRLVGKPTMWFPNSSDTNRAVQALKKARDSKFWF